MTDYTQLDPQKIEELSKVQLVEAYLQIKEVITNFNAQQQVVAELLTEKIEGNGEVVGDNTVTKAQRMSWFPDLKTKEKLEKARELGAVKETVDSSKLKKIWQKGVDIPHRVSEYLLIKPIKKDE